MQVLITNTNSARCTSAAPGFFKPYSHTRCGGLRKEYIDGGMLFNNPVSLAYREALLAFREQASPNIDILLSLGTGLNEEPTTQAASLSSAPNHSIKAPAAGSIRTLFTLVKNQIELNLQTELQWERFITGAGAISKGQGRRFKRINPWLGSAPPELDQVSKLKETFDTTTNALDHKVMRDTMVQTAKELVASCFYFKLTEQVRWNEKSEAFSCKGQ